MATYTIPPEPDGPLWVTIDGKHQRVTRSAAGNDWGPIEYRSVTWPELLALGEVSDVHPDLPADAPLPWTWTGSEIEDADGGTVARELALNTTLQDEQVMAFVVKAVNAYGERVTSGWPSDADRAIEQARAAHDEAEITRLNVELAEVLGEVRAILDGGPGAAVVARNKLRTRLGGA